MTTEEQDWPMRELIRSEAAHQAIIEQLRAELRETKETLAGVQRTLRRLRDEYRALIEGDL